MKALSFVLLVITLQCNTIAPNSPKVSTSTPIKQGSQSVELSWVTSSMVFHSKGLNQDFPVSWTYPRLPDNSNHRLTTVLFLDGQYVFSAWNLDQIRQDVANANIRPAFFLGIHSTELRDYFYTPTQVQGVGGSALAFLRFLHEEFLPFFGKNFPLAEGKNSRTLVGASHGALLALYQANLQNPKDGFGNILAFSPTIWWDNRFLFQLSHIRRRINARVFLHSGGKEHNISPTKYVEEYALLLNSLGTKVVHYHLKDGEHNAKTWANVLPIALRWIEEP